MLCSKVIATATSSGPYTSRTAERGTVRPVKFSRFGLGNTIELAPRFTATSFAFNVTFKQRFIYR